MSGKKKSKAEPEAEVVEAPAAAPEVAAAPKVQSHKVAAGRNIACGVHGLVKAGETITAGHLSDDPKTAAEAFAAHLESGSIVKA